MSQGPLPGFRDFYPDEFAEREYITGVWRDVSRRFAFVEYDGPPLENLELYTRKSGDEIVGQLYTFTDKGDRDVALRPEMTPTLARMVAARAQSLRKPVRWFSIPQLFRYERQQKGRLREHFQLNVDIIGEASLAADAELLACAIEVMRSFGLTTADVRARVSDRRMLNALLAVTGVTSDQLPQVYNAIDKLGREPMDVTREKLRKATGSVDTAFALEDLLARKTTSALRDHPSLSGEAADSLDRMEEYFALLEALGVRDWVDLDLSIVRGLAYYTGTVFELFDARGEFRAVCGGGRYDDLLEAIGGTSLPALGFGMGDVVLGELLRARGLMPKSKAGPDFWVASDDESALPRVMAIASALRSKGRSAEYSLKPQSLSRQLKAAVSSGAREAVILKKDSSSVTVRNLADGSEHFAEEKSFISSV